MRLVRQSVVGQPGQPSRQREPEEVQKRLNCHVRCIEKIIDESVWQLTWLCVLLSNIANPRSYIVVRRIIIEANEVNDTSLSTGFQLLSL